MTVRRIDGDERSPRSSLRPQMAILTRHAVESAFPGAVDARCPPLVRNGNPRSKSQQFDVVDSCSPRLRTLSSSSASPVRRQQAKSGSARSSSFDKKGPTWCAFLPSIHCRNSRYTMWDAFVPLGKTRHCSRGYGSLRHSQVESSHLPMKMFDMQFPLRCRVAATMLQSDLLVEVADMSFHLHKVSIASSPSWNPELHNPQIRNPKLSTFWASVP